MRSPCVVDPLAVMRFDPVRASSLGLPVCCGLFRACVEWANPDFADSLNPSQNVLYSLPSYTTPSPPPYSHVPLHPLRTGLGLKFPRPIVRYDRLGGFGSQGRRIRARRSGWNRQLDRRCQGWKPIRDEARCRARAEELCLQGGLMLYDRDQAADRALPRAGELPMGLHRWSCH